MDVLRFFRLSRRFLPVLLAAMAIARGAMATDFGAASNGTWSNSAIWTPSGGPPGTNDNAYIGSNYPGSSAATASVALGGSQTVNYLYLGYGAAANSGTLNLAGNHLTVNAALNFGYVGGTGTIVHNGGYFSAQNLALYSGNSLVLAASDSVVASLSLTDTSHLTTASAANLGGSVSLYNSSTLTLGASMSLSGYLDLRDIGTKLDMAGHPISVSTLYLGWYDGQPVTVLNRGSITAGNLSIANEAFNLLPADAITAFSLSTGGSSTTSAVGNVNGSVALNNSGALTLGSSMSLTGSFDARDSGTTFNMAGHPLSASSVLFGWYEGQSVTVLNRGPITASNLQVGYSTLNLTPSDSVSAFYLENGTTTLGSGVAVSALYLSATSHATTTGVANVNSAVQLFDGSVLTLGSSMTIAGSFDARDSGSTLNMAGHPLSAGVIYLGWYEGQPVTVLNRGPLVTPSLYVGYSTLNLTSSDAVGTFNLNAGTTALGSGVAIGTLNLTTSAQATTATVGNVSTSVQLFGGSLLTLGSSMTITGTFDERDSGTTFNMASHPLSANTVYLGWYEGQPVTVLNRGPLITPSLNVSYSTLNLTPSDAVAAFSLNAGTTALGSGVSVSSLYLTTSAQATTTTVGNVTTAVQLYSGSLLTLGSSMTLTGSFDARDLGSTLNMAGHPLSANVVYLGWYDGQPVTVLNRGPITAAGLQVANSTFNLIPSDAVTNFSLDAGTTTLGSGVAVSALYLTTSAQATTTTAANISTAVQIFGGSSLTLGSSMTLTGTLDARDSGTKLNMAGHPLSATTVLLGWYDGQPVTVLNRGPIAATNLQVGYTTFNLLAADAITNFSLYNGTSTLNSPVSALYLSGTAQATTTAVGKVTSAVQLYDGSTLTLGTSMSLDNSFDMRDSGSTLNMAGHPLSANVVYLGWYNNLPVNIVNPGAVVTNALFVAGGSHVPLSAPSSVVNGQITISSNSVLTLQQPVGPLTGMTFYGSTSAAMSIDNTSVLQLSGGSNSNASWIFRWQDVGGSWESSINSLIAAGRISVSSTAGYSVFDDEGYTYVATPSTLYWNGGGTNNNWSTAGNWSGTAPTAGHWLRFGALAGGGHTANTNNLTADSLFYGIFFDAAAPSYNLQGNAIQLSGDVLNQSGTNQTIGLNIQLVPGDGAFDTNTIAFDTGAKGITDSGSISGSGMALMKTGTGTLILSGTNNYNGGTIVAAGKLMVTTPYAILDGTSLTVGSRTALFGSPIVAAPTDSGESTPATVPEPEAFLLLAATLAGVAAWRRFTNHHRNRSRAKCNIH